MLKPEMFTPKLVSLNLILESLKMCHAALQVLLGWDRAISFFFVVPQTELLCSPTGAVPRRDLSDYNHLSPGRRLASPSTRHHPSGPVLRGLMKIDMVEIKWGSRKNAVAVSVSVLRPG